VTSGEQADDDAINYLRLPDDDLGNFAANLIEPCDGEIEH
jgi:hypothetical protein